MDQAPEMIKVLVRVKEINPEQFSLVEAIRISPDGLKFIFDWKDDAKSIPGRTYTMPHVRPKLVATELGYYVLETVVISPRDPDDA